MKMSGLILSIILSVCNLQFYHQPTDTKTEELEIVDFSEESLDTWEEEFYYQLDFEEKDIKYLQNQQYTYYVIDEAKKEISISKISEVEDELVLPTEIDGYKVTALGMLYDNFSVYEEEGYPVDLYRVIDQKDLDKVKKLVIPEGIRRIGTNAFRDMTQLTELELPSSLIKIYSDAFAYNKIKELKLPENLICISNHSFYGCEALQRIQIKSKNLMFSDEYPPFAGCNELKDIIWDHVENINMIGFRLNHIKRMVVPSTVKVVDLSIMDTLIIKGSKTEIECRDAYILPEMKKLQIILPKNSAAVKGAKLIGAKYEEVTLPKAPNLRKKQYSEYNDSRIKLSWDRLSGITKYQIYYSKTKTGTYEKIAEIGKNSYSLKKKTGYIKVRAYKTYQGEKWYGPFSMIKL